MRTFLVWTLRVTIWPWNSAPTFSKEPMLVARVEVTATLTALERREIARRLAKADLVGLRELVSVV